MIGRLKENHFSLLDVSGDWHEFESKQRKRQKGANNSNIIKSKPTPQQENKTKATPSSTLSSSSRPH